MTTITVDSHTIETSHDDKVFFPEAKLTKGDLVEYYRRIADTMLPYISGRVISMHRYPDGIGGFDFYEKEYPDYFPEFISAADVPLKRGGRQKQVVVDSAATLVYLAEKACVTPHMWLCPHDDLEHPDIMVFDLDPSKDWRKAFGDVTRAARAMRDLLEELDLPAWLQITGSRGLHVFVPLAGRDDFDTVRDFAHDVARVLVARDAERLTLEQRKDKRGDKIFVDYLRNSFGQTAVPPYAVRGREGAPVATPIGWDELGGDMSPRKYTLETIFQRLARKDDPWKGMMRHARTLASRRKTLDKRVEEEVG